MHLWLFFSLKLQINWSKEKRARKISSANVESIIACVFEWMKSAFWQPAYALRSLK